MKSIVNNDQIFLVAALSCVATAVYPISVVSHTPVDCDVMNGIDISFSRDINSIHAWYPKTEFIETPPAHGDPGGDGFLGCSATVQFDGFPSLARFAIANVTWNNDHLAIPKNTTFTTLGSKVELSIEHLQNYSPVRCPLVKDLSKATLIDIKEKPGLEFNDYDGEFKLTKENPNLVWSNCFGGYGANATKITFSMQAWTKGKAASAPGWSMDFGLVWEDCYPPAEIHWGQRVIKNWETCTYRESNETCYATLPQH
ncbi:hypothetical protein F4811DRAFT_571427 [Daldinia bambusicola]|nr:hypothetical protein F4811DRAFT_571427 [Daldinia bambusicola]